MITARMMTEAEVLKKWEELLTKTYVIQFKLNLHTAKSHVLQHRINMYTISLLFFSKDMRQLEFKWLQKTSTKPYIYTHHTGQHPHEDIWNDTLCKTTFLMNPSLQNIRKYRQTMLFKWFVNFWAVLIVSETIYCTVSIIMTFWKNRVKSNQPLMWI
jgi:ABC-type transport system involved in Fe-S cluster assembly fused permease/ATPase subunit